MPPPSSTLSTHEGPAAHSWLFVGAAATTTAALVAAAAIAAGGDPKSTATCLVAACVPYLVLAVAPVPASFRRLWAPMACASIAGLAMAWVPRNPLSDDVFRFAWDARVWLSGGNAYDFAPASPALASLRDDALFPQINHPTIPTIYPPVAQGLFVLGYAATGGTLGMKLLGLAAHLLGTALLPGCARSLSPQGHSADPTGPPARASWLLALNPLSLSASALGGHFDLSLGLCVLLAATALVRGRLWRAAGYLLASIGLKLVGVFGLPLLARRPIVAAVTAAGALLLAAPLTWAGSAGGSTPGVAHFGQRWQGNAGPFVLLTRALEPVVEALASQPTEAEGIGEDEVLFRGLQPVLAGLERLGVRPKSALRGPLKPQRGIAVYPRHHAVGLLARACVAALVFAVACGWAVALRRRPTRTGAATALRATLWCLLLLSPQVHPWYLLWLLPLELAAGGLAMVVWTIAILGAYAPLPGWHGARLWQEPAWFVAAEYALVATGLLLLDLRRAGSHTS